jgi:hypothetical protein
MGMSLDEQIRLLSMVDVLEPFPKNNCKPLPSDILISLLKQGNISTPLRSAARDSTS